jgi:hypothetical protein
MLSDSSHAPTHHAFLQDALHRAVREVGQHHSQRLHETLEDAHKRASPATNQARRVRGGRVWEGERWVGEGVQGEG